MGISYKPLFHLLVDRGLKGTDLTRNDIISAPTLAKLSRNQPVNGIILQRLCEYFNCQYSDIIENTP